MKRVLFLPALIAIFLSSTATAQGWYYDGGYAQLSIDIDTSLLREATTEIDHGAVFGHMGYDFSPHFGLEGEVLVGTGDGSIDIPPTQAGVDQLDLSLNYLVGAYGKVQMPLSDRFSLFARAGFVSGEAEANIDGDPRLGGAQDSDTETGLGIGLGTRFMLDDSWYVRGDYTRYEIEDTETDLFGLSVGYQF